ncbi:MAG: hypothetical protein OSB70_01605 [Myxococcota bacterium]|nr:hypothetical protein [Myxococcota bacterium]
MSEFEFVELAHLNTAYLGTSAMNVFSIFVAYTLAAHFAGKLLSRNVAAFVSAVYSLFLIGPLAGIVMATTDLENIKGAYLIEYPAGILLSPSGASLSGTIALTLAPALCGWLGSLAYMHAVVREKDRRTEAPDKSVQS